MRFTQFFLMLRRSILPGAAVAYAVACSSSSSDSGSASPSGGSGAGGGAGTGTAGSLATAGSSAAGASAAGGTAGAGGGAAGSTNAGNAAFNDLADGWASVVAPSGSARTTGGAGADAAHTYTVTNRKQLVLALYPDAQLEASGAFSSAKGADSTPKIIYVQGSISLNTNLAGVEQTEADYACSGYALDKYEAAYDPKVWNKQPLVSGKPPVPPACPGTQEALRMCSEARQASVVRIAVGSNTSILGLGNDAKLIHGTLLVGTLGAASASTCTSTSGGAGGGGAGGAAAGGGGAGGGGAGGAAAGGAAAGGAAAGGVAGTSSAGANSGGSGGASTASTPGANNVVIRNITFEDSFDYFPQWTPTDSYTAPPAAAVASALDPKCQATYDASTDNGPHQCRGGRWNSEYDNISVMNATHVWVDHCTFNDGSREDHLYPSVWQAPYVGHDFIVEHHDGLVDVTLASDFVTLSYNKFQNHDKTNLLGGSDKATPEFGFGALSVTLHHNYWENAGQRMPRVRFGRVHSYNNYVTGQLLPQIKTAADLTKVPSDNPVTYAMGIGYLAKLYSEANVFEITQFPGDPPADESAAYFLWHKASPTTGTGLDVNGKTYFFDAGSTLNGSATNLFAHAQAAAAAANPPKPALVSTDSIWKPASSYSYTATSAAAAKAEVMAKAGAGKL